MATKHSPQQSRPEDFGILWQIVLRCLSSELSVPPLTWLQKLLLVWNFHLLLCQNSGVLQKLSAEVSWSNQQHHSRNRNQHAQLVLMYCICFPDWLPCNLFLQQLLAAARSSTLAEEQRELATHRAYSPDPFSWVSPALISIDSTAFPQSHSALWLDWNWVSKWQFFKLH